MLRQERFCKFLRLSFVNASALYLHAKLQAREFAGINCFDYIIDVLVGILTSFLPRQRKPLLKMQSRAFRDFFAWPNRWELIAALREAEPATVAALSQRLKRHYKNVHADVNVLIEWMAVERGADGRVFVPWTEIVVDMKLPEQMAT